MADGDIPVSFEILTPPEAEARANIALSEARGVASAVAPKTAVIVAGGPSARDDALWERLARDPETVTVALNNALTLFTDRGLVPTYWCACDQQALVADFLPDDPPRGVIYLLASKVHPAVFDKLAGRDVRLWRLDDYGREPGKLFVPCAVSITLVTQGLFRFLGFHRFEMYGWDGCYIDGAHHAVAKEHDASHDQTVTLRNAEGENVRSFATTGPWMAEANDAAIQALNFRTMGYELVVHGDGMFAAILKGRGLI